ncbi:hypothetical protein PHISP_07818 [Aspergillus sp. HF37]|nr:hypothetical protein PHISP_07818 [Aspergillus sp. HF37]
MAALVNALGILAGSLGIISFGINNFGKAPSTGSTIKVAVALDGSGGTTNAGGGLPDVRVWDDFGAFQGMTVDPGKVEDGTLGSITVNHDHQGVYSLFSANNDAICIAWITTTWSDDLGGNQYAVSGDFGATCGMASYYSNMYINDDTDYQPLCFWIDKNGDTPQTGFQVRWPAYASEQHDPDNENPNQLCNGIDFGSRTTKDPSVINYYSQKRRRESRTATQAQAWKPRPEWAASKLVISDNSNHPAAGLCESRTSWGPDFANANEKAFCDMGSKVTYPFCGEDGSGESEDACFDFESKTLSFGQNTAQASSSRVSGDSYNHVIDWRKNNTMFAA